MSIEKLTPTGRFFFAVAFIGLGVDHFIFQDFIVGRATPWPELIPGKLVWAYLSGTIFIVVSIAILSGKKARLAVLFAGLLIFLWALLRHIPVAATDSFLSPAWTKASKALKLFGGAWAIAGTLPKVKSTSDTSFWKFINQDSAFIVLGRICLGIYLLITGIQHFMFTEFVAGLIPSWFLADAIFWTYFGGVALIAGGVGLCIPQTAKLAALLSGIMIFSWFWIIHVAREVAGVADGIAVFEALATAGIAFALAGALSGPDLPASSFITENNEHQKNSAFNS